MACYTNYQVEAGDYKNNQDSLIAASQSRSVVTRLKQQRAYEQARLAIILATRPYSSYDLDGHTPKIIENIKAIDIALNGASSLDGGSMGAPSMASGDSTTGDMSFMGSKNEEENEDKKKDSSMFSSFG